MLDIRNAASFADYFVIASAGSERQLRAVLDSIDEKIGKEHKIRPNGREGEPASGWVLLDYGDVIVHVFAPEERQFYDLEALWSSAVPVVRIQ